MEGIELQEIQRIFEREGLGEEFKEQEPLLLWPQVVGEQMSKLTQPLRVRQGVLYIEAASHVVAQQLSLLKEAYLNRLNELLGEERLADLRFRVSRSLKTLPHEASEGEQLSLLERERLVRLLDELEDPHLREVFERLILAVAKRDQVRAAQGYKQCAVCGVHHDGQGEICYYCELES
jgi:hypothetical protein